jgi:hypothetical protein
MVVKLDNRAQVGIFPRENLKPFHKTVLNQLTSVYTFSKSQMDVDFMRVGLLLSVAILASFLAPVRANDSAKPALAESRPTVSDEADSTKVAFASESDRCLETAIKAFSENAKPQGKSGSNLTGEGKGTENLVKYRSHHRRIEAKDKTLILGGAEAFSM